MPAERPIETDQTSQSIAAWIADYKPTPGAPDELLGPDGRPRAHWRKFLKSLLAFGEEGLEQRFAAAAAA